MTPKKPVAIVTGASQGIGEAIALTLAALDYDLVLTSRSENKLRQVEATILSRHPNTEICVAPASVSDPAAIAGIVDQARARWGGVAVLVNNAGVAHPTGLLQEISLSTIDEVIDTNLKGCIYWMHGVLPLMVAQGGGVIVNINSVAGKTAYPYWSVYDASKFGLRAITEAVAEEQRSNNIRVVGIYPGAVDTPIWDGIEGTHKPSRPGMLSPQAIASAVRYVLEQPPEVFIPELTIAPTRPLV